jgi:signal transduction histidine kinase
VLGRSRSLTSRIAAASILLVLVFVVALGLLASSIQNLQGATHAARRSQLIVNSASRLEKLAIDMETGERGFLIAGKSLFLEPYNDAVARYPTETQNLEQLVANEPAQHERILEIARALRDYQHNWSAPVIALASKNLAAGRAREASEGGKRRLDALRRLFSVFIDDQDQISARRSEDSDRQGRNALLFGVICAVGSALLIVIYAGYLLRVVTAPVRHLVQGARRLSQGELSARVPAGGVGEVAQLGRDFNSMADSLQASQEKLTLDNAKLQAVLDATLDGICMTDIEGNLLFANRKMDQLWHDVGLRDEGTIWDRLLRLAQRTTTPAAYFEIFQQLSSDPDKEVEADFTLAEDGRCFVGYTAPVRRESTRVGRIFAVREVTEEREVQRLKDEFVATVSHELRTPLTSIVGYVELLLDPTLAGELSETQAEFVTVIGRNAERLQQLVADLLFFAQVEAQKLHLEYTTVDLAALADRARAAALPLANDQGVSLEFEASGAAEIEADRARLAQLLDNLVSNAVKFTPQGGSVCVRVHGNDDHAILEVEDTGIGIPEDEAEQLFQRFFRASTATAEGIPGTGLGLAIVKTIVEAHGGTIEVLSALGKGTTVRVRLPNERVSEVEIDGLPEQGVRA